MHFKKIEKYLILQVIYITKMGYITVKVVGYDEKKRSLICMMAGRGVVRVRMVSYIPPYIGEEIKVEYWRTNAAGTLARRGTMQQTDW